jgi:ABC-type glycerol-3-phosphate transport system substrate-binding protein
MEFLNSESNALKIAEFTGNFPANDTAIKDHYQNDPERLVLREQLKTAVPRPKIEGWITVNDNNLGAAIEEILTTTVDIQTRLNRAKREAEAYLFKK